VINETIAGEAVMIDLNTGTYYSLDAVGAEIWDEISRGASLEQIVSQLEARYDAPADAIEGAVRRLADELERENLIVGANGDAPAGWTPSEAAVDARKPFEEPTLQKFTDMQDLVLLDPVHEVDERGWPHQKPAA
jgi:hypothetical protein